MITSQNANNKARYEELFALATKILNPEWEAEKYTEVTVAEAEFVRGTHYAKYIDPNGEEFYYQPSIWEENVTYYTKEETQPEITINSISDLFGNMEQLRSDSRFLLLPLDEDIFEIDANKRLINIPDHFKRNGVSVQGDEIAETLLFKIDRYFDSIDLNECTIVVQWENKNGDKYVTPIKLIDTNTYGGQILFGWPLSSTLTEYAGPIKFSIRFIKYVASGASIEGEEEIPMDKAADIVYSFSTLTAQVNINPGLNFNIFDTKQDDPHHLFNFAITNSEDLTQNVKVPELTQNLPTDGANKAQMFLVKEDGSELRKQVLVVRAVSADAGTMTYQWWHAKYGVFGKPIGAGEMVEMPLTAAEIAKGPDAREHYFEQVISEAGEIIGYVDYDFEGGNAFIADKIPYVRNNVLTISGINPTNYDDKNSITGDYWVIADNRVGNAHKSITSNKVEFPTADPVEIILDLVDGVIGKPSGSLTVNAKTREGGYVFYNWQKSATRAGEFATDETAGVESNVFAPAAPGFYKVEVTSEVNLDQTHATTKIVRVTEKPVAVKFADGFEADDLIRTVNVNDANKIEAGLADGILVPGLTSDLDPELLTDGITYKWYIDKDAKGVLVDDHTISNDAALIDTESAIPELNITEALSGQTLRCVAINRLNGEVTYSESVLFSLIGAIVE